MNLEFRGPHQQFLHDTTPEIDLEGSRSCGKTIVCLWKELDALRANPGMWSLIARFSDDATKSLLQPELERVAAIHGTDLGEFNRAEGAYELPTGSRIFSFGLKTVSPDPDVRYKKIRGLSVSRIYIDQAEELPGDIASELRFPLRPDITARTKGLQYPRQLTFSPNPVDTDHWLAKQFPASNKLKGRKYYSLSLYDNAHNLPPEMIESLEQEFPPDHPKHRTLILGERGPNIIGNAIYDKLYDRGLHRRVVAPRLDAPLLEAFELGKHNPFWLVAQRSYYGGLSLLGGLKGQALMLEDFLPLVKQYRAEWFPGAMFKSCTSPMGEKQTALPRVTLSQMLRDAGIRPVYRENSNAPDVQLAMIEEFAGYLRRRLIDGQAFAVNGDSARWLVASMDGVTQKPWMAYALEGGYVWSENEVSVSHDRLRRPKDDDDYANAMRCVENILLNFCVSQRSESDRDAQEIRQRQQTYTNETQHENPLSWMAR